MELRVVDFAEILALTEGDSSRRTSGSGTERRSFSHKSVCRVDSSGNIIVATRSSSKLKTKMLGHVQARVWAGQVQIGREESPLSF